MPAVWVHRASWLLMLALIAGGAYLARDTLLASPSALVPEQLPPCLGPTCRFQLVSGTVFDVAVTPSPAKGLSPITFTVNASEPLSAADLSLDGESMVMSGLRLPMLLEGTGGQSYRLRTVLPLCSEAKMRWRARFLLRTHSGRSAELPLLFDSLR